MRRLAEPDHHYRLNASDRAAPLTLAGLVPLSGVVAVALIAASLAIAGTAPAADAPLDQVASFYATHATAQQVSGALLGLGTLPFLLFAATVVGALRGAESVVVWSRTLVTLGAVLVAVALAVFAALALAIGQLAGHIDPAALQALHVLDQDLFVPLTLGMSGFLIGAGVGVLRSGALGRWLGWMAVGAGLLAVAPSHVLGGVLYHVGFIAFAGLVAWTVIASLTLTMRSHGR
jgi:hypothetical protein